MANNSKFMDLNPLKLFDNMIGHVMCFVRKNKVGSFCEFYFLMYILSSPSHKYNHVNWEDLVPKFSSHVLVNVCILLPMDILLFKLLFFLI